eukprot:m.112346 g.112346  ORF g.112346 m.112346 type:complete len:228 (-) comp28187_c0_seq1:242-925(-)
MDYKQEQADEVEALESIFPDALTIYSPTKFALPIEFDAGEFNDVQFAGSFLLVVTFTDTYPEGAPVIELDDVKGLDGAQVDKANIKIAEEIEECLGDPLVFTVHASMTEWLEDELTSRKTSAENFEKLEKQRLEDEEMARLTSGTLCNLETFLEWRERFEAEMAEKGQKNEFLQKIKAPKRGSTTGRKLFEINAAKKISMDEMLQPGDVVVDNALFGDLDLGDLDLE